MSTEYHVGIDGCRSGWFYTVIDRSEDSETGIAPDIGWLWDRFKHAGQLLVDIPIGLSDQPFRKCDIEARKLLGPGQGARVFPPPCREAVYATSYDRACIINQRQTGKKISRQTWNIVPKIREMDTFMRCHPQAWGKLRESHPEICFRALCGRPLLHSKKTLPGVAERLDILQGHLIEARRVYEEALKRTFRKDVTRDDILDSMITAVTARYACQGAMTLPQQPERDPQGLPMEMVYPAAPKDTGHSHPE